MKNTFFILSVLFALDMNAQEKFEPGTISTDEVSEYGLTFIAKDWICITKAEERSTLMYSYFRDGRWTNPVPAPFSGVYPDEYPKFDAKSGKLFFASKRPASGDTLLASNDLWYVQMKSDQTWSNPTHLGGAFSTEGIDSGPVIDNGTVYFHSDRKGQGQGLNAVDLYALPLDAPHDTAKRLSISSEVVDGEPFLFADGTAMLFMSGGFGAVGGSDVFLSIFENGAWTTPTSVDTSGNINTLDWEYSPVLSPDLNTLYFTRWQDGQADIFQVAVETLTNERLKEIVKKHNDK